MRLTAAHCETDYNSVSVAPAERWSSEDQGKRRPSRALTQCWRRSRCIDHRCERRGRASDPNCQHGRGCFQRGMWMRYTFVMLIL